MRSDERTLSDSEVWDCDCLFGRRINLLLFPLFFFSLFSCFFSFFVAGRMYIAERRELNYKY